MGRAEICAVQADNLTRFWALLLKRMQWMVPPKAMDEHLVEVLSVPNGGEVLDVWGLRLDDPNQKRTFYRYLRSFEKAAGGVGVPVLGFLVTISDSSAGASSRTFAFRRKGIHATA